MKIYNVLLTETADNDISDLFDFIVNVYKSYNTAHKFKDGLLKEIKSLKYSAGSYQISTRKSLLRFGYNSRKVIFKSMTIVYTIHGNDVYIRRVIPSSTITGI